MRRERPAATRRWSTFWLGLAVSIVLHALLALFMLTGEPNVRIPPPPETAARPEPRWEEALRAVRLPEEAFPVPAAVPEVEPTLPPEARGLPAGQPVPAEETGPGAEFPGEELTNAERLRPRIGDPRLWTRVPIDSLAPGLREEYDRAEAALRRLLQTYLDSLELSEEQRRRAREWVWGEGDEKWGISSEGLHLGDVTIPIPFGQLLSRSGENRRRAEQVLRTWEMIQFQAGRIEAQEVREERLEAIRERTRERRRSSSADGSAGADSAARDTTGG